METIAIDSPNLTYKTSMTENTCTLDKLLPHHLTPSFSHTFSPIAFNVFALTISSAVISTCSSLHSQFLNSVAARLSSP
jgi:hypothetical protein